MTRIRARALAAAAAIAWLSAGHLAQARPGDDREAAAAEIFKAGAAAYARRDYRAAALSFEAAFREAPHGGTIYNAGLAWEAAKEPARAADAYQAALDTPGLEGKQAKDAARRLGKLEGKLGRVEVTAPAGATVWIAHAEGVPAPARVHVAPGEHEVKVELAGGKRETRRVEARAGEAARVTVEPPPEPPPPEPAPPPPPAPAPGNDGSTQRTLGWVALGVGGVMAAGGTVMGVLTLDARQDFENSGRTDVDARDRTLAFRAWTNASFIGAAVLGGVGVVLVLTAPSGGAAAGKKVAAGLCLAPGRAAVCGRF